MQEKGWDVGQTIEKLLRNGTRISTEAHEIVRIPGLLTDADMIGGCCAQPGLGRAGRQQAGLARLQAGLVPVVAPPGPQHSCAATAWLSWTRRQRLTPCRL